MANSWCTYNGKVVFFNGKTFSVQSDPRPTTANTLRFKFSDTSYVPTVGSSGGTATKGSWTAYDASAGIWDWTYVSYSWSEVFRNGFTDLVLGEGNSVELISASEIITATNMSYMFFSCTNLTSVALVDTNSVANMTGMFAGCSSLTSVPLFDTSSVTNMREMFNGCRGLTDVPLFDTSSVTNMISMFQSCIGLTTVPLFDTSSVTNMTDMFQSCSNLISVPLFNTSSVKYMDLMFNDCYNLENVPLFDTSSVENMFYTFAGCENVQSGALALYTQASSQSAPPPNHYGCFKNCGAGTTTGAAELAQIPWDWK